MEECHSGRIIKVLLWHDIARCCRESPREGCAAEGDREKGVGAGNCQVRA